jgi:hypothetical protein
MKEFMFLIRNEGDTKEALLPGKHLEEEATKFVYSK